MQDPVEQKRFDLFDVLPSEEWEKMSRRFPLVEFEDKSLIYHQGEKCGFVYIIAKGHVKLSRMNIHGDEFTLAILSKGDIFGAALTTSPTDEVKGTATVKGGAQIYRIGVDEFNLLLSSSPLFSRGIISLMSERQQFLEQKLESLVFKDVQTRLAETLYELAGHYGERCPHGFELDIRLTQQELADLVCAGRPVVSTLLNQFRDQGILAYDRDFICINQIENFKKLINV
ncbi:MAG: Crp/Fnr family transcriptional regulator [Ignavibacteriales bacterium]|nr:Crp/Fnr family transcriptional regulator [Ignavibacteriales bacterium]